MGGDRLARGSVPGEAGEGRRELVDRGEQILRRAGIDAQMEMELVHRLDLGDLEEEGPAIGQDMSRLDGQRGRGPACPGAGAKARESRSRYCSGSSRPGRNGCLACSATARSRARLNRHQHAILDRVAGEGKLDRLTGVAHPLEAAVAGGVRSPARHAGDVELTVPGVESPAMNSREKITGQGDDGSLGAAHRPDRAAPRNRLPLRMRSESTDPSMVPSGRRSLPPVQRSSCPAPAAGRRAADREGGRCAARHSRSGRPDGPRRSSTPAPSHPRNWARSARRWRRAPVRRDCESPWRGPRPPCRPAAIRNRPCLPETV